MLLWYQVADLLKSGTVEELRKRMTFRELLRWKAYIEWKTNDNEKLDYYLAQIACEVKRSVLKEPGKVQLKDFLIPFETKEVAKDAGPPTPEALAARTANSKAYWKTLLGFGVTKKKGS